MNITPILPFIASSFVVVAFFVSVFGLFSKSTATTTKALIISAACASFGLLGHWSYALLPGTPKGGEPAILLGLAIFFGLIPLIGAAAHFLGKRSTRDKSE